MRVGFCFAVAWICAMAAALPAGGAEPSPQAGYHLFNPVPDDLLRDLSPDRPDATESPITVDAGRVQLEMSFADYRRDDHNDSRTDAEAWTFGAANLKFGLTHNMDVQFVFDAYTDAEETDETTGTTSHFRGFNDVQIRWKINFWGNDGGATAFGIMPFIQLPVGSDDLSSDHIEGGVIVPFAIDLGDGWGLGLMAEFDFVYDDADDDYDTDFVHTAVLGHDLIGDLGGYLEYTGIASGDGGTDYAALLGVGLTYQLNRDTIFDFGVNIGLNEQAEDFNIFTGITRRF